MDNQNTPSRNFLSTSTPNVFSAPTTTPNNKQSVKFDHHYFYRVFERICQKQKNHGFIKGYEVMRWLSKNHKKQFEISIKYACVDDIGKNLPMAKIAAQFVRFLKIEVPPEQTDINNLQYISANFLPKIEKIDIVFYTNHEYKDQITIKKRMQLQQDSVFRGINIFFKDVFGRQFDEEVRFEIKINSNNFSVTIIDSNFDQSSIQIEHGNQINIEKCIFKNTRFEGLDCSQNNTVTINSVKFIKSYLIIGQILNNVTINKLSVENIDYFYGLIFLDCSVDINESEFQNIKNTVIDLTHAICNIRNCKFIGCRLAIEGISSRVEHEENSFINEEGVEEDFEENIILSP